MTQTTQLANSTVVNANAEAQALADLDNKLSKRYIELGPSWLFFDLSRHCSPS